MTQELMTRLREIGIDPNAVLRRFAGNTALYQRFLRRFMEEDTMLRLREAARGERWEDMLAAAHTLKGVSGNLGLDPLYRASADVVAALRARDLGAARSAYSGLEDAYAAVCAALARAKEDGVL